ncbi:MAG: response regulator [Xanthomonadales bacterium]|nr:response regulator [Xanthomonadales bacterium]
MTDTVQAPCVLVCEDEMMVAMLLQDRLENVGFRVLMAARVQQGLALAASEAIDVALLDINLAGEESFPVAEKLRERGIPFVFSSGYAAEQLPEAWHHEKVLQKPYDTQQATDTLNALLEH